MRAATTENKEYNPSNYQEGKHGFRDLENILLFLCYDWLARVFDIGHLVRGI